MIKYFEPNKIFSVTSKAPKYVLILFIIVLSIGLTESLYFHQRTINKVTLLE